MVTNAKIPGPIWDSNPATHGFQSMPITLE